jgi:hypothetical protein
MGDLALSLLMLTALGLIGGAILRWRREGPGRNVWLMLVAAAVMLANVAIWVIPDSHGAAPIDRTEAGPG